MLLIPHCSACGVLAVKGLGTGAPSPGVPHEQGSPALGSVIPLDCTDERDAITGIGGESGNPAQEEAGVVMEGFLEEEASLLQPDGSAVRVC